MSRMHKCSRVIHSTIANAFHKETTKKKIYCGYEKHCENSSKLVSNDIIDKVIFLFYTIEMNWCNKLNEYGDIVF